MTKYYYFECTEANKVSKEAFLLNLIWENNYYKPKKEENELFKIDVLGEENKHNIFLEDDLFSFIQDGGHSLNL